MSSDDGDTGKVGFIRRFWRRFWSPSMRFGFGGILIAGFVLGVGFWGAFNWSLALTNTEAFCISCHEMRDNVYEEYKETIHFTNRTGVRATCSDCHVPKEWVHKMVRKVKASKELYHKILGTIDTKEKFKKNRLSMARREWIRMKTTDSRECRNCHNFGSMDLEKQEERASDKHDPYVWDVLDGKEPAKTCIDCHMGVAHKLAKGWEEVAKEVGLGTERK